MKTVQLTRAEINLIQTMMAIASSNGWGDGDYQNWTSRTRKTYASLQNKLARKEPSK